MKKIFKFAFLSVIALVGASGFTSCSSTDEAEVTNPNFNPETNEVITKFVFNVATGNEATTRQSSAATQATNTETFRGIDHAALFSFKNIAGDGKTIAAAGTADKRYDLARIVAAGSIDKDASTRVIETSLPLNTNSLLFYGKAIEGTSATATDGYDLYGHLENFNIAVDAEGKPSNALSNTTIELASRIADNKENFKKIEDLLAGMLTCIMNSNLVGSHHDDVTFGNNAVNYPDNIYWASYANTNKKSPVTTDHDLYALEVKLAEVYKEMTTIRDEEGELRGGCAHNYLHTIQALWTVINEVRCANPFCEEEAVAQALAKRIHNRLEEFFNATVPTTGGEVTGVSFKGTNAIIEKFTADSDWPNNADTKPTASDLSAISSVNLAIFPEELYHLPAGSAHYLFDNNKKQFYYVQDYNTSAMGNASGFTVDSYYYPAELCYFGNSPIRVSTTEHKANDYPQNVTNWHDSSWSGWTPDSHVESTTMAVAMKNDINYGTALLKSTVAYGATTLKDNNHDIQKYKDPTISDTDEPDKQITVTATSFQVKGFIIGGQTKKVGWDYLPKAVTSPETNPVGYIYDCSVEDGSIPVSSPSAANYTLVFDNYTTAANQDKVYVAVELLNNSGEDFYGEYGLIRNGGTFYLVGELNLEGKTAPTWPTYHPLPPYNADGSSIQTPRVFMQDYMTTAKFVIGENSLKHAYLTVPDLRYSSLTLGLSVDIEWSTGIDFNEVILGGN